MSAGCKCVRVWRQLKTIFFCLHNLRVQKFQQVLLALYPFTLVLPFCLCALLPLHCPFTLVPFHSSNISPFAPLCSFAIAQSNVFRLVALRGGTDKNPSFQLPCTSCSREVYTLCFDTQQASCSQAQASTSYLGKLNYCLWNEIS